MWASRSQSASGTICRSSTVRCMRSDPAAGWANRRVGSGWAASWRSSCSAVRYSTATPNARSRSSGGEPGPSGGGPLREVGLELLGRVVEQGHQQPGAVAEAPEDGALAHVGRRGHRLHRDPRDPVLGDQPGGGLQQPGPVAGRVGTQARLVGSLADLQHTGVCRGALEASGRAAERGT